MPTLSDVDLGFGFSLQAEILQNVYTDCTRLDEALKRGESLRSEETDSSKKTDAYDYAPYNESSEAAVDDWNCSYHDSSYARDYLQHDQTDESCATKDPYREIVASTNETSTVKTPTSYAQA